MDTNIHPLMVEDWRYYAIEGSGAGVKTIATQEKLGEHGTVGFGLPSVPALYLNLARAAYFRRSALPTPGLFDKHPQGVWPDDQGQLFDFFEGIMTEIVFSALAIEAFANEVIPDDFVYPFAFAKKTEMLTKHEIERRVSLDEKLKTVLPSALGISSPAGTKVWERFKNLSKLRDRLVHLKAVDRKSSGPNEQTIFGELLNAKEVYPEVAIEVIGVFIKPTRRWFSILSKDWKLTPVT